MRPPLPTVTDRYPVPVESGRDSSVTECSPPTGEQSHWNTHTDPHDDTGHKPKPVTRRVEVKP